MSKWRCMECEMYLTDDEMLTAPNPFDTDSSINGCPFCYSIGLFAEICDEPCCKDEAGCGWPSDDGYRRTCWKHANGMRK